jgi:hypothetical protein
MKKVNVSLIITLSVFLCSYNFAFDATGLVAYWNFDEGQGDTAFDSASSNDATLVNGPGWTTGQIGQALDFDGMNDYIIIPDSDTLSLGNKIYTISAWINPRTLSGSGGGGTIVSKVKNDKDKEYRLILIDGNLWLDVENMANNQRAQTTSSPVKINIWQHVAVSFNSSTKTAAFYYNGTVQPLTSNIDTLPDEFNDDLYIGKTGGSYYGSVNEFDGSIDEVRIYNRVLSAEEIQEISHGPLLGLEIVGPNQVADNFHAQYRAIADYELASNVDVTDSAEWSIEADTNVDISAGQLITHELTIPKEQATIYAEYAEGNEVFMAQKDIMLYAMCPQGSALEFDGADDYVSVFDNSVLRSPKSISVWVKQNSYTEGGKIIMYPEYKNNLLLYTRFNHWRFIWDTRNSGGDGAAAEGVVDITSDTDWHFLVATNSGSEIKLYDNGVEIGSETGSFTNITAKVGFNVGSTNNSPAFKGAIDNITLYNKTLTSEEIQHFFYNGISEEDSNIVAYWSFDEGDGQIAYDSSGNGNDGYLGNDPCDVDNADPVWVDGRAIPCTLEGFVEKHLDKALDKKVTALDLIAQAIEHEWIAKNALEVYFDNCDFGSADKSDVIKARQRIGQAIQKEEAAEKFIDRSIESLEEAYENL